MKNIRENYTLKTFKEFVIDNYSDLFEELNKPALGKDLPKHQTLSNKIINKKFSNRTNVNNNANKPVGQGVKAIVTNANITTPKMKLSANNSKNPLGKSISNKNESYYYTYNEQYDNGYKAALLDVMEMIKENGSLDFIYEFLEEKWEGFSKFMDTPATDILKNAEGRRKARMLNAQKGLMIADRRKQRGLETFMTNPHRQKNQLAK